MSTSAAGVGELPKPGHDLLVRNVRLIEGDGWSEPVDLAIEAGRIAAIERHGGSHHPSASILDGRGMYAIPGLVNGHTHAHNGLVRATGDDRWLELHILRMAETTPFWTADEYYAAAALGALEMVRTGTTVAIDMVTAGGRDWRAKIEAVMAAYRDVGISATVAPTLADIPFAETLGPMRDELPEPTRAALATIARTTPLEEQIGRITDLAASLAEKGTAAVDGVHLGIGPLNPVQCSDTLLNECADVVSRHRIAVQTHLLESKLQALAGLEPSGATAVARLQKAGLLGPETSLVHCVWLSDADAAAIARSGAVVVHCPASNMKLGSGIAPVRRYIDHGVTIQLGTDGAGSGDNQNMFQSMWLSALLNHVLTPDPNRWLTSEQVFRFGTASSLSNSRRSGAIEVGGSADLALLDPASTFLTPRVNPVRSLVYSEVGFSVRSVVAGGRLVLEDGESPRVDVRPLVEAVDAAWQRFTREALPNSVVSTVRPSLLRLQQQLVAVPYVVERHPSVGVLDA